MWIFTVDGLLMPAAVPPEANKRLTRGGQLDLQVRGRDPHQLARFRRRFFHKKFNHAGRVPVSRIELTPHMDYQCRFYTTRGAFGLVLAAAIMEIDYKKFKPAAGLVAGVEYEESLNRIWNSLAADYGAWGSEGSHVTRKRYAPAEPIGPMKHDHFS